MRGRTMLLVGLAVALSVGGALGLRGIGLRPVQIASSSMVPTVEPNAWILVRDLDRDEVDEVERGDIVMFRFPLGTSGRAIKRIVATAGDRVAIRRHGVTVNGRAIEIAGAPSASAARQRVETVPAGTVFLLGDNAARSIDSRSFGPVPYQEIVARHLFTAGATSSVAIKVLALVAGVAFALVSGMAMTSRLRASRTSGARTAQSTGRR